MITFLAGAVAGSVVTVVSPKVFTWVKSKVTKVETAAVADVKKVA